MFAKRPFAILESASLILVAQLCAANLLCVNGAELPELNLKSGKQLEDLKLIPVPLVRQATEYTCGPAAVESVLGFFGDDYNESQLAQKLHTNSMVGTYFGDIVAFARLSGYKVAEVHGMTLDALKIKLDSGLPVICLIQAWPEKPVDLKADWKDGHYVVAIGYDADNVYFMDPWTLGNYTFIGNDEFLNRWHDKQRGRQIVHLGIVLSRPAKKKTS